MGWKRELELPKYARPRAGQQKAGERNMENAL